MSDLPPIPDPLECVLFDAGDTLLAPSPSFHGRFVQVAARHGFELEEAAAVAAIAATVRAVEWPTDWTDPATQRWFWLGVGITPVLLDRFARVPAADGHRVQSMTELVALLDGGV